MKHYFQKYGIACMIGLVIFVLILPLQVFAAEEDSSSENSRTEDNMTETDLEKTQEETEQKIWDLTEVKDLDTAIRKLFPEEKLHFQDLVESVIRQDENLSAGQIRNFVTDQFFYVLKVNKPVLASIIFLVLIAAVFSSFSEVFQNRQISQTAFFLVYLSVITVGIRNFQAAAGEVQQGLENLILFMRVLCPVYFVCMAVAVGSISAIAFYNLALFLIFLVELVILKWIVPLIQIALLMEILNNLTEEEFLSKAAELLRLVIGWSLKSLLALVTGIGFIERIISPAADQVKRSVWTKGVGMIPGIGDIVSGTSEVVLGSAVLLKNGVGIAGALLVTGVVMIPVINMGILTILYKGTAALIQPVSDKRIVEAISFTGEGYHMLLKTVLATAVLFLVTLAVAASAAS